MSGVRAARRRFWDLRRFGIKFTTDKVELGFLTFSSSKIVEFSSPLRKSNIRPVFVIIRKTCYIVVF